ncbi:MAG: ArnT family glycosyltransferase [Microthrixaceae bacterium]
MTGAARARLSDAFAARLSLLAVLAVTLPPLYGLWRTQGTPMEEGFMLTFPEMVLDGKVPNRDFLHLYGPGSLWVLAAVFAIFGVSLAAERTVGFLQHLGVAFGVHRLLRPWGPWVAAGGGALSALIVLTPSGLSAMAWVGGVGLGLWALAIMLEAAEAEASSRTASRGAFLGGVLAGAALLYRLDLVVAVGASGTVVWLALERRQRARLLRGFALGCSPYLVHLAMAGARATVEGLVLEPVFDLRGGRRLPIPPNPRRFDGFLQGAGALDQPPWPLPAPSGPRQLWLWFFALLAVGVILLAAGLVSRRRSRGPRMLAIACFSLGLFPQALQRPDSTHLGWVSCVAFAVLPAAVIELWRARRPSSERRHEGRLLIVAAVAAPAVLLLVLAPFFTFRSYAEATVQSFGRRRVELTIEHAGRTFPYKRHDAVAAVREMLPVVDRLTRPGQRLIVGPGDLRKTPYSEAFLYYLLPDLVPGTRYIEMDPGVANAPGSGLADEVARADVVILSTIRDDWNEPNDSLLFGSPEPGRVLARDFCLVGSFGVDPFDPERGLYELYTRCSAEGDTPKPTATRE